MFSFKNLLTKAASALNPKKDQVILEGSTDYLYLDIKEGNEIVRHTVHAPSTASDTSYDNTSSGLTSTTVQGAIDELLTLIRAAAPDITVNTATGDLTYNNDYMTMNVDAPSGNLMYQSGIYNLQVDDSGDLLYDVK